MDSYSYFLDVQPSLVINVLILIFKAFLFSLCALSLFASNSYGIIINSKYAFWI